MCNQIGDFLATFDDNAWQVGFDVVDLLFHLHC
jgi:hypothetical protein